MQNERSIMSSAVGTDNTKLKAMGLMVFGMMFIPLGDSFAKLATEATTYSPAMLAWARFALGAALFLPLAVLTGNFRVHTKRFWFAQLVRGGLFSGGITSLITAVSAVPLADAFGAFFIGPAVATILARFVLAEPVHRLEWIAICLGFVGVMLIVKPGGQMAPGILWALLAGCFYGGYLVATRWANTVGPPLGQLAAQLCVGMLLLTPFALMDMKAFDLQAPALLFGSGFASATGNLFAIMAFARARAGTLTPLVYAQLISATFLGWFIFADSPDMASAIGLAIITIAGFSPLLVKR